MGLNGPAFAGYGNALAAYLMGSAEDVLTPVAPGTGDPIPFVSDGEGETTKLTESGVIVQRWKTVFVAGGTRPIVGDKFTFGGETWQVSQTDPDRCAGSDWPNMLTLVGHARQASSR